MRDITNQHAEPFWHLSAPALAVRVETREAAFAVMSEALEEELDPEEDVKNAPFRNISPSDFQSHFFHSLFGAFSYLVTCTSSQ